LERAIEQMAEDQSYQFAVLFLDLDRFKFINDSLGHTVGDQLLVAIAQRLRAHLRVQDVVARLGGDEFAILLNGLRGADEAADIADRIQVELSKPFTLAEQHLVTTTSIGIALGSINYEWPEDLLRDADMAMYQAKAKGRARHEIFKLDLRTELEERWQLESDLRHAIERAQFQLYFQPILSVAEGHIVAVEALLRWEHPQQGLIDPETFISLAEEIGMISSIGGWVLRTACTQMVEWHASGYESLRLSVNVSPFQLQQPPGAGLSSTMPITGLLPELVRAVLAETGLPPHTLELEITESMAMLNQEFSLAILQALSEMGVQIAVDDFGLGSALDFLRYFPIDTLKIDQSFVREMTGNSDDQAFITAIIAMAHSLGLKVVAEGVETEKQLELLQNQNCDEWQGYLFSPPLSAGELAKLLKTGKTYSTAVTLYS
jgi:diguanylate cyclase (GGDEF)-like protein